MARSGALSLVPSGPSRFGLVSPPVAVGVAIRPFANSQVAAVGPSFARTPFHLGRERRGPLHRDAAVPGASSHRGSWAALAGPKAPPDGTRGGPRHHEFGGRTKHVRMIMHAGIRALVQRTRTPPLNTDQHDLKDATRDRAQRRESAVLRLSFEFVRSVCSFLHTRAAFRQTFSIYTNKAAELDSQRHGGPKRVLELQHALASAF